MARKDYSHLLGKQKIRDVAQEHLWLEHFEAHSAVQSEAFRDQFGDTDPPGDMAWLVNCWGIPLSSLSISACPPSAKLRSWHHVSCGLSIGAWDSPTPELDPDKFSGHGCEFVLALPSKEEWAANLIVNLVRYILSDTGKPVDFYHTIACKGPIRIGNETQLRHLTILKGVDYQWDIRLPAGNVDFFHLYGLTDAEAKLIYDTPDHLLASEAVGAAALKLTGDLVTDPGRKCYADNPAFRQAYEEFCAQRQP